MSNPTKVREVQIPRQLRNRPRDSRGYVIPWLVVIDANGIPDFRVSDEQRRRLCLTTRLCGLCGSTIQGEYVFIGGDKCVESLLYFDPPMHEACARYARRVCPFLAYSGKEYNLKPTSESEDAVIKEMPLTPKPQRFVMVFCRRIEAVPFEPWLFRAVGVLRSESWVPV